MHPQRQHLNATPTAPRASSGALGAGALGAGALGAGALGAGALCTVGGVFAAVGGPETIEDTVTQ